MTSIMIDRLEIRLRNTTGSTDSEFATGLGMALQERLNAALPILEGSASARWPVEISHLDAGLVSVDPQAGSHNFLTAIADTIVRTIVRSLARSGTGTTQPPGANLISETDGPRTRFSRLNDGNGRIKPSDMNRASAFFGQTTDGTRNRSVNDL